MEFGFRGMQCCPSESSSTVLCETAQPPVCLATFCSPAHLRGTERWAPACLICIYTFSALSGTKPTITSGGRSRNARWDVHSAWLGAGCCQRPQSSVHSFSHAVICEAEMFLMLSQPFLGLDLQKKPVFRVTLRQCQPDTPVLHGFVHTTPSSAPAPVS